MKRKDIDRIADEFAAQGLRKDGPLLDVELHTRCGDGSLCPPIRGKALVDTGADRTAIEFAALDPRAKSVGAYRAQGVTSESVSLPIYSLKLHFPGSSSVVEVDHAAATPHLRSQGLVALLGRDVLGKGQLNYNGPAGTWNFELPEGTTRALAPSSTMPLVVGGALGLAALSVFYFWPKPCELRDTGMPPKTAGGPGVPMAGYTLHFENEFPDSTFLGISFPGLCGGMVFTVLDYASAGILAPTVTNTPSTDTPLGAYIHDRQVDSLASENGVRFLALLADPDDDSVAEVTDKNFTVLKNAIDRGVPVPLGLIPAPWTLAVTNAHQVLATGYTLESDGSRTVVVWDPNYPNAATSLHRATGTTLWVERGGGSHDQWRGFFVEAYTPRSPPSA